MTEDDLIQQTICALDSCNPSIIQDAKTYLIGIGPAAVDRLIETVRSESIRQYWEAASVLAAIGDPRCVRLMEQSLTARNPFLGVVAVEALEKRGVESMRKLLSAYPACGYMVQLRIVRALEAIGDQRAVAPLMEMLKTTDAATMRYTIIQALGVLGDPRAVELIRSFRDDADHHVRERVQIALERLEKVPGIRMDNLGGASHDALRE